MKSKAKRVADMAMFLAVGVVLNICSFPILGSFGRASFVYLFCYTCGIFLGPYAGFLISFAADFLPAILFPQGAVWIPLISFSVGVMAFIMGMCHRYLKVGIGVKIGIGALIAYFVCTLGLTPLGEVVLFNMFPYTFAKTLGKALGITSPYAMLALSKGITQCFWTGINAIAAYFVCKRLLAFRAKDAIPLEKEKVVTEGAKHTLAQ